MKALTFKRYGKSPEIGFTDVRTGPICLDRILLSISGALRGRVIHGAAAR